MKPSLMINDMQKEFFTGNVKESMTAAEEYINEVAAYFRVKNCQGLPDNYTHQSIRSNVNVKSTDYTGKN